MSSTIEAGGRLNRKAVVVGLTLSAVGVVVAAAAGVVYVAVAAYGAAQRGASQQQISEQVWRAMGSGGFALTVFAAAALFTALGGYAASRTARRAALLHALPVGALSLSASVLFILLAPAPVPTWFLPLALALPIPLAAAGAYLASLNWSPLPLYPEDEEVDEDGPRGEDEEEALRRQQFEQMMLKNLKRQQQQAQSVGQLVQQRRARELEQQQQSAEEQRREALEQAMEQARAEACEEMREIVREAFMSHPAATEEDFERCWPAIRDEMFKQYTLETYHARLAHQRGNGNG